MVHGGGSCSGGGFSGGGYSGGTFMSTNNYYGGSSNANSEECAKCMTGVFRCLGVCICCKGQDHFHTIMIFWGWVIVLFLITGLSVGLGRFGSTDIPVSPSDMVIMKRGIDPVLCEGVSVRTTLPVNTYLLPSAPNIASERVTYSFNKTTFVDEDKYEYWGFYLIAGSDIEIITCTRYYGTMYIIKGDRQFGHWKEDNDDSRNSKTKKTIGGCNYPSYLNTRVSYHISSTDEYYFVFANHDYFMLDIDISFRLNRTVYDLGERQNIVCSNSTACDVTFLGTDSSESIVVYVPPSDEFDFDVTTKCLTRDYLFVVIFLLIPVMIGSLFTICMLHRKRRADRISIRSAHDGQRRTFTRNSLPPQYQTMREESEPNQKLTAPYYGCQNDGMTVKPPSYGCQDDGLAVKPPTYEEAVARSDRV
ncbi:uncharacterized protein LOC132563314 [Ylistrum balloti]|uniref:uncharacterized protein LOC132563314 n=1 Tax=Ylistrum balloti TaxID=509963 RepID=UPI0029059AFE|nr:uncharacterized protein LOC132563314 [Ylistrum balloti]